jgi:uncharacterized OB-fold protein
MSSAEVSQYPRPVPDGDTRPYWEGVAKGELRIQRCDACGEYVFYPRALCPRCHAGSLAWVAASGDGTIYSYTVVHQAYGPFAGGVPFVVALVELAEGPRMMTRIVGEPEAVKIGAPVRVTFEQVAPAGDGNGALVLPYFRLAEG